MTTITDNWTGCYSRGWGNELTPDSFAHPAKVGFVLAQRIYAHALEHGFIERGGSVLDPFGGVGGFAYGALFAGLNWTGVELEEKFVTLGCANIAAWNARYGGAMQRWGTARLLHGDSRRLLEVVGGADLVVSSPPYADSLEKTNGIDSSKIKTAFGPNSQALHSTKYGAAAGQLGALREGDLDLVLSSPPFGSSDTTRASEKLIATNKSLGRVHSGDGYGESFGQLGNMAEGAFDAVVGSPPYEDGLGHGGTKQSPMLVEKGLHSALSPRGYGGGSENVGHFSGDSFWGAARDIVAQCYMALRPGGHAIWVTKRYVKGWRIVEFTGQWIRLCESVGFVVTCQHRAMLVRDDGERAAMVGDAKLHRKERKSFFRRLAEKKGSPAIDWEDVVCMVKPAAQPLLIAPVVEVAAQMEMGE